MLLTNQQIYNYTQALSNAFQNTTLNLPVKVNFYLQKNMRTLHSLAQDIEVARMEIAQRYGELQSESSYIIPQEKIAEANQELTDLFALEQEVQIYMINLNSFKEDQCLTLEQMEAIMFMIVEPCE